VTSSTFSVTQAPIDCNDKIKARTKEKLELPYSKIAKKSISAASFFNLDDAKNCPLIDCKLFDSLCTSDLNDEKKRIVIGDKAPWNVIIR